MRGLAKVSWRRTFKPKRGRARPNKHGLRDAWQKAHKACRITKLKEESEPWLHAFSSDSATGPQLSMRLQSSIARFQL